MAHPSAPDGQRIRYVCMPGSPFTGSTLLGLLLNEHPQLASIGAATGLIRTVDLSTYACSCGKLFRECEFWAYVATRTRELGPSRQHLPDQFLEHPFPAFPQQG